MGRCVRDLVGEGAQMWGGSYELLGEGGGVWSVFFTGMGQKQWRMGAVS